MSAKTGRPKTGRPPVREFSFSTAEPAENVPFKINGQLFHAYPMLPGLALIEYAVMFGDPDHIDGMSLAKASFEFLQRAILPEDWDRFYKLATDPAQRVTDEALGELAGWLVGVYTANPTDPSTPSGS